MRGMHHPGETSQISVFDSALDPVGLTDHQDGLRHAQAAPSPGIGALPGRRDAGRRGRTDASCRMRFSMVPGQNEMTTRRSRATGVGWGPSLRAEKTDVTKSA